MTEAEKAFFRELGFAHSLAGDVRVDAVRAACAAALESGKTPLEIGRRARRLLGSPSLFEQGLAMGFAMAVAYDMQTRKVAI